MLAETDDDVPQLAIQHVMRVWGFDGQNTTAVIGDVCGYKQSSQLLELMKERDQTFPQVVAEYEAFRSNTSCEAVREQMRETLKVMRASVENGILDRGERTHIITGYGHIFNQAIEEDRVLGGSLLRNVVLYALAVGQHNAGLGRIVACPTAGACGVVPGAMLAVADELGSSEEELIEALLVMAHRRIYSLGTH